MLGKFQMTPESWGAAQLFLMFPNASFLVSKDAPAYGLRLLSAWSSPSSPEGSCHWLPTDLEKLLSRPLSLLSWCKDPVIPLEAVHDPAQHSRLLHCLKRAFHQLRINTSEPPTATCSHTQIPQHAALCRAVRLSQAGWKFLEARLWVSSLSTLPGTFRH